MSLYTNSTYSRAEELNTISDVDQILKKYPKLPDLPTYLDDILQEKNMSIADVAREAQLDHKYIYQIFDGRKKASRDKIIAIAYGFRLSEDETQTLLKISGYQPLYSKADRDIIILWAIKHGKNLSETNEMLYDRGFQTLT